MDLCNVTAQDPPAGTQLFSPPAPEVTLDVDFP